MSATLTLGWFIREWGVLNQQLQIHGGDVAILRLCENIGLKRVGHNVLATIVNHPPECLGFAAADTVDWDLPGQCAEEWLQHCGGSRTVAATGK